VDRREKASLVLSAFYCAWHDLPAREFSKPETIAKAIAWFRSKQESRFAAVENLFRLEKDKS
jgi:hypothetical protein